MIDKKYNLTMLSAEVMVKDRKLGKRNLKLWVYIFLGVSLAGAYYL